MKMINKLTGLPFRKYSDDELDALAHLSLYYGRTITTTTNKSGVSEHILLSQLEVLDSYKANKEKLNECLIELGKQYVYERISKEL